MVKPNTGWVKSTDSTGTKLIYTKTFTATEKCVDTLEEPNGLTTGAVIGISCGGVLLLLLVLYTLGYFCLYRKGKLDESAIKVIYKFLPRGNENTDK